MTKEALADKPDLEPMAIGLATTFLPRRDPYARHLEGAGHMCSSIFAEGGRMQSRPTNFFYTLHIFLNSSSPITFTPSALAFSYFEPGASPSTR